MSKDRLSKDTIQAIITGTHPAPFSTLGSRAATGGVLVRAFLPDAEVATVVDSDSGEALAELERIDDAGLFEGLLEDRKPGFGYRLRAVRDGDVWEVDDPYRFGPVIGELDNYLLGEGSHKRLWERLGAHLIEHQGTLGVHFAVWAPNAERVAVVGDFNRWDGRCHPMRLHPGTGVWEIFLPGLGDGVAYKYEIRGQDGQLLPLKADPFAFGAELRPKTASVVRDVQNFTWGDEVWLGSRASRHVPDAPVSIHRVSH